MTTTATWLLALRELLERGEPVSPLSAGAAWRGRANRELRAYQTAIPMDRPVLLSGPRKLGFKFMAAEAAWICSGDNRVSTIAPYAKAIGKMSDDGQRFFGAYGPKFVDQLSFAVQTLVRDPASRQAIVSIWREQPRETKDTPCTLSWQYLIRNGKLDCVATMRSSDIWMGWVYDVFNFSMAAACVALEFRAAVRRELERSAALSIAEAEEKWRSFETGVRLGNLYLTAGSQHLYDADRDGAQACLRHGEQTEIAPLNLAEFESSEELIAHLWDCAKGVPYSGKSFLRELFR